MKSARVWLLAWLLVAPGAWAEGPMYEVGVAGLACPFCAYGIEKRLEELDGVKSVTVDVAGGIATVTMDEGADLTREEASEAVTEAGFTLESFNQPQKGARR